MDWVRRSLQQILFVDRSDTVRARFAVGMFERVAGAAGASRVMQAYPCGVQAEAGSRISWSTQASLFSLADSWRLRPHLFTAVRQRWEEDDIDRFELVVCMDSGVMAEVLKDLSAARPAAPQSYVGRTCCLSDFLLYCPDEALLRPGSSGLLDRQLRELGGGGLTASHDGEEEDEDSVAGGGGDGGGSSGERWERAEAWDRMALLMVVCCAGLVQYLLDCRPDDAD